MEDKYIKKIVVALGGNAILKPTEVGSLEDLVANLQNTSKKLAQIFLSWYEIVITYGNGPQVGNILSQNELCASTIPSMPLDVCGAQSQGQIGYLLQLALSNELRKLGKTVEIPMLLTNTLVDPKDPAFSRPTKPIGPWLGSDRPSPDKNNAYITHSEKGFRRVVPSPRPVTILNSGSVENLLRQSMLVIACGGGGIPVYEDNHGILVGLEAVIDKDIASARLAAEINADILMILTDVPAVFLDFGTDRQRPITKIDLTAMKELFEADIFPEGSIGPKVEAAIEFVEQGGTKCIISSLDDAENALKGTIGTTIYRPVR